MPETSGAGIACATDSKRTRYCRGTLRTLKQAAIVVATGRVYRVQAVGGARPGSDAATANNKREQQTRRNAM